MRNIRTKRIKTESLHYFAGPFQDSILEIQLDKHKKALIAMQKNQFEKANQILQQITNDKSIAALDFKEQNTLESLTSNTKAYLCLRQGKYDEGIKLIQGCKSDKKNEEKRMRLSNSLSQLIKGCILCRLDKLETSIEAIKQAFKSIKNDKIYELAQIKQKNIQKYSEIFIIFFDMIALELGKMAKFEDILNIYKQAHYLSIKILGKDHKLTGLMSKIVKQNSKDDSTSEKNASSNSERCVSTKGLNSKRRLKVNENKMTYLSTKEKEMKKIYYDDEIIMGKLCNKLTRRDETYYLKSLEKVRSIYNSRNEQRTQQKSENMAGASKQSTFFVNRVNQSRYEFSRLRIKDIILRGKRLNKDMIYVRQMEMNNTNLPIETISNDRSLQDPLQPRQKNKINEIQNQIKVELKQSRMRQEEDTRSHLERLPVELTLPGLAAKVEEKQAKKEECQLI